MSSDIYRSRLDSPFHEGVVTFVSSLADDVWLFFEDIMGTQAHDIMLYESGILSKKELRTILSSLENIMKRVLNGSLKIEGEYEDIHEYVENMVISDIGLEVGGKIHTARSRNDQVALDLRLKTRNELLSIYSHLIELLEALLKKASKSREVLVPLYTHTQQAQIGSFAHYFLAYFDAFSRDMDRLIACFKHVNLNPLGACAIGGTRFPINRFRTTELLGFDSVLENSLDAISSRDFALEVLSALAILFEHLSKMCGDLILWSSSEFNFIEIPDAFASTSSVMPQKKNPCALELIRARSSRVYGSLIQILVILKGLPTGYNRDLQETKIPLKTSFEASKSSLSIYNGIIKDLTINEERVAQVVKNSSAVAVDLAEMLVQEYKIPFRTAHILVGRLVNYMMKNGKQLRDVDVNIIANLSNELLAKPLRIDSGKLIESLNPQISVRKRISQGSPSPSEINRMLSSRTKMVKQYKVDIEKQQFKIKKANNKFKKIVTDFLEK